MKQTGLIARRVRGRFCQLWFRFKDGLGPTRPACLLSRWTEARSAETEKMGKRKRRRKKKSKQEEKEGISWMAEDGMHALMPGEEPSAEKLAEMTKEYQKEIRKSALWKEMVETLGREKAEEVLRGFRVELR